MRRLGVLLSVLTSGCSFMFAHGAPSRHESLPDFDCVSSHAAPAADIAGTVIDGVLAVALASAEDNPDDSFDDDLSPGIPIAFGALAVVHLTSAVYGFANVQSCENAKKALAIRRDATNKAQVERIKQLEAQIAASAGCGSDKTCKSDRICIDAHCVTPPTPASASEPASSAPAPETAAPAAPATPAP